MHRIFILTDNSALRPQLTRWVVEGLAHRGLFPEVDTPAEPEAFFHDLRDGTQQLAVVAVQGVAGLNTAEHFRSICPQAGLLWCCDLDFSLQAYRLRADYFILGSPTREELETGIGRWLEARDFKEKRSL